MCQKKSIIVGGGQSVNEGISKGLWGKIKNKDVWSLNSVYKLMPFLPTREIWTDRKFFDLDIAGLQLLSQKSVKLYTRKNSRYNILPVINQYEVTREVKLYKTEKSIMYTGRMGLTGLFAISLAIFEKYNKVFLLGFDFGSIGGIKDTQTHFYQNKIKDLHIYSTGAGRPIVYCLPDGRIKDEVNDFKAFLNKDTEIINVSTKSHIPFFEKISYDEFFKHLV